MKHTRGLTVAALGAALAMTVGAGQAAAAEELLPHPGPDGLIWVPEVTGSSGFVSGGLWSRLDTFTTFACEGGGSIEVTFHLDNHPDRDPAPFTLNCPAGSPAAVTVPLGTGLTGGFGATVTTSSPSIRWAATVTQPE
ncbi:hypothetical protein OOK31_22990 [Streptomyces sp. NBC_00249]|uniref:hypothetical protein n=1 Tax=Streptomyces sp. NBC_00249 TaxID=2975690 RepID=UPI0022554C21|nr:hypothetical protein [Streptomyces sp. NBC_00249]MCX5196723.1 hypothetical protein [Streptomyces sp. NBC_00249]